MLFHSEGGNPSQARFSIWRFVAYSVVIGTVAPRWAQCIFLVLPMLTLCFCFRSLRAALLGRLRRFHATFAKFVFQRRRARLMGSFLRGGAGGSAQTRRKRGERQLLEGLQQLLATF